jgi:hypothetical protein
MAEKEPVSHGKNLANNDNGKRLKRKQEHLNRQASN